MLQMVRVVAMEDATLIQNPTCLNVVEIIVS